MFSVSLCICNIVCFSLSIIRRDFACYIASFPGHCLSIIRSAIISYKIITYETWRSNYLKLINHRRKIKPCMSTLLFINKK